MAESCIGEVENHSAEVLEDGFCCEDWEHDENTDYVGLTNMFRVSVTEAFDDDCLAYKTNSKALNLNSHYLELDQGPEDTDSKASNCGWDLRRKLEKLYSVRREHVS